MEYRSGGHCSACLKTLPHPTVSPVYIVHYVGRLLSTALDTAGRGRAMRMQLDGLLDSCHTPRRRLFTYSTYVGRSQSPVIDNRWSWVGYAHGVSIRRSTALLAWRPCHTPRYPLVTSYNVGLLLPPASDTAGREWAMRISLRLLVSCHTHDLDWSHIEHTRGAMSLIFENRWSWEGYVHGVLSRRQMQHAWCGFVTPAGASHVYGPVNHTDYSITSSPVIGTARGSWRSGGVDTQDGCLLLWRNQDSNPCSILTVGTLPKGGV